MFRAAKILPQITWGSPIPARNGAIVPGVAHYCPVMQNLKTYVYFIAWQCCFKIVFFFVAFDVAFFTVCHAVVSFVAFFFAFDVVVFYSFLMSFFCHFGRRHRNGRKTTKSNCHNGRKNDYSPFFQQTIRLKCPAQRSCYSCDVKWMKSYIFRYFSYKDLHCVHVTTSAMHLERDCLLKKMNYRSKSTRKKC